jgi:tetratricopeptide (TPR) repeat protein
MNLRSALCALALGVVAFPVAAADKGPSFDVVVDVDVKESLAKQCALAVVDQTDIPKALELCNAALAENPDDADTYYYRGFAHFYLDNYPAAEADFSEAIRLNTSLLAKSYYQRGVCKERQRRMRDAAPDFKKAHELAPDWVPARRKFEEYWWAYE